MHERINSSKRVYNGQVVRLDILDVTLPNGNLAAREVVRHPGAVAIVPVDSDGQVVLVRQYRTAAGQVMIEIPAGTLEPGEDPVICATRELQEEAGLLPGELVLIGGIFAAPGYTTEYIHLYLARDLTESTLPADEDEFIEVFRVPLADALRMVEAGEINDSKTVVGLLRAREHLSDAAKS